MNNLDHALINSDTQAFNNYANVAYDQFAHDERIEELTDQYWDDASLIDDFIINDDVILASVKAMVKALNNKNDMSALVFAKSVQIQLNNLINNHAEKAA